MRIKKIFERNSILSRIKILTSGESHGKGSLGIIDGIPSGLEIDEKLLPNSKEVKITGIKRRDNLLKFIWKEK